MRRAHRQPIYTTTGADAKRWSAAAGIACMKSSQIIAKSDCSTAIVVLVGLIFMRFPSLAAGGDLREVFNDTSILSSWRWDDRSASSPARSTCRSHRTWLHRHASSRCCNATLRRSPIPLLIVIAMVVGLVLGASTVFLLWSSTYPHRGRRSARFTSIAAPPSSFQAAPGSMPIR